MARPPDIAFKPKRLADRYLATLPHANVASWSGAVYLLSTDTGSDDTAMLLRGPYIQSAYRYGWRHWYREAQDEPWQERIGKP